MAGYFIDPEEEQSEQPRDGGLINWEDPFCLGIQAVFNGASAFTDVASGKQWTNVGLTFSKNPQGMAAVCNQASAYASRVQAIPPNSPGWTVAAAFVPISSPASDHAIVGFCQSPKSYTYDRSILNGTGAVPQGYLHDGATGKKVYANGPGMVSGVPEVIVVTATTSLLTIYRKGYAAASLPVINSGYTGYTGTPEFCVGAANNVAGQSNIALAVLANRPWSAKEAQEWIDNPAKIFKSPPIDIWVPSAGGSTSAAIAVTDGPDTAAVVAATWTTAQIAATDGGDVAGLATTVTTGAAITGTDGADNAVIAAANWTTAQIAGTDGADVSAITASANNQTSASIGATDGGDAASVYAANWTTALLAAVDGADTAALVAGTAGTTSAGISATDGADIVAIGVGATGPLILAGSMRHAATLSSSARLATTLRGSIAHV